MADEYNDANILTLTDEDGKECSFEVIAEREIEGITYYALLPLEDNEDGEYVLLKLEEDEDGESVNRIYNNEADDTYEYYSDYYWVGAKDGVKMLYVITYAVEIEAQNDAAQQ